MKSVLIKNNHSTGNVALANPAARPGRQSDAVTVVRIDGIPDGVPTADVVQAWEQTVNLTWLTKPGDPMESGRFEFYWSEIGAGKIIR